MVAACKEEQEYDAEPGRRRTDLAEQKRLRRGAPFWRLVGEWSGNS
jgi:hypothetical protein